MKYCIRMLLLCSLLFSPLWASAGPVDINTADAQTLAEVMQGVGDKKAEAIVADREKNGPFRSVDDLARVKGISEKTVEANRAKLTAGGAQANTAVK